MRPLNEGIHPIEDEDEDEDKLQRRRMIITQKMMMTMQTTTTARRISRSMPSYNYYHSVLQSNFAMTTTTTAAQQQREWQNFEHRRDDGIVPGLQPRVIAVDMRRSDAMMNDSSTYLRRLGSKINCSDTKVCNNNPGYRYRVWNNQQQQQQQQQQQHWFSTTSTNNNDNEKNEELKIQTPQEQHAFYQEQLLDLHREEDMFGGRRQQKQQQNQQQQQDQQQQEHKENVVDHDRTPPSSSEQYHASFHEQMLDLQREQEIFSGRQENDDGTNNNNNNDDIMSVAENFMSNNNNNNHGNSNSNSNNNGTTTYHDDDKEEEKEKDNDGIIIGDDDDDDDDDDHHHTNSDPNSKNIDIDDIESKKIQREEMYEFSSHDRTSWGKPQPDHDTMQQVIKAIHLERQQEQQQQQPKNENQYSATTPSKQQQPQQMDHESFSHVTKDGTSIHMVDVGKKDVTSRMAHARSEVWLPANVLAAFLPSSSSLLVSSTSDDDNNTQNYSSNELIGPKGPIFATAKLAGIMGAKRTSDLIPLCHPLPLDQVQIDITLLQPEQEPNTTTADGNSYSSDSDDIGGIVIVDCICRVTHKTGVEMEALTGCTIAALTIYDMTKAISHHVRIKETKLIAKTGGKRTVG